ncbi:MAG: tetratricopeptide repeat protein [Proteobacteria bacterium]|nr:tetratricopeptide repeat protein [Pseudomonadota bacterium]
MKNLGITRRIAGLALLLGLVAHNSAADADPKIWKQYCDDARKAAAEHAYNEAEQFLKLALAMAEKFGENDPRLVETLLLAAGIQIDNKHHADAEPHLRRALALREARLGAHHLSVAECAFYLGGNLSDQKKYADAEQLLRRAESICKWKSGAYHPLVGTCQAALAHNYALAGRYDEADKLYTAALKILGTQSSSTKFDGGPDVIVRTTFIPDYPRVMQIRLEQAQTLELAKKYAEAETGFKKLIKLIEDRESKDSVLLVNPLLAFGRYYAGRKNYPTAEALLLRSDSLITQHGGPKHRAHLAALGVLERVYRDQGKIAEADGLAGQLAGLGVKSAPAK